MSESESNAKNELSARDIYAHKVVVGTSIEIYSGPARDRTMMADWLRQLADIHRETSSGDEIDRTLRRIEGAIGLYEGTNESHEALDTFRTLLAVGLARWDLFPSEGHLEEVAPYLIPSLLGEALWQIVLIPRLPEHWLEALHQITSPAVALWISNVRAVMGKHNEEKWRIELTRHLASPEWQDAVQRLLDDLSDPAGGAPVVEQVLRAQRRTSREAIRDRRSLVLVILSTAGAGVIGNRADALVVRLVDQALKSLAPQPAPPSTAPAGPDPGSTSSKSNRPAVIEILSAPGVKMPLVRVPAGPFLMGSDKATDNKAFDESELPQHRVDLSDFLIGRFPVTVAEFAAFVQLKRYVTEAERAGADQTWRAPDGKGSSVLHKADHPVTHLTWADANAFCAWLSIASSRRVRLPTEAQWEKAARGTDGRIYPWGNTFAYDKASSWRTNWLDTTPVGAYSAKGGDSEYDCADMVGNVWEWCADWYSGAEYRSRAGLREVRDPLGPRNGTHRIVRGGWYFGEDWDWRCAARNCAIPDGRNFNVGFRVVVSPSFSSL